MNKIKEKLLTIYIILNILYIFIGTFLNTLYIFPQKTMSYGFIAILIINIIIAIILIKKKKYQKNLMDLFILIIIFFGIIATIFAYKPDVSLFGENKRYEGLITICYYFSLFFITRFINKKDKKLIIYIILFTGIVQAIYAILQINEVSFVKIHYHYYKPWASGFVYNPNFFGTYMLLCLSYTIGLYVEEKNMELNIIQGLLIIFFMIGLLISNTLSVLVGLMTIMILVIYYMIKNKIYKKIIPLLLIIIIPIIVLHCSNMTTLVDDLVKTKNETVSMANGTAKKTINYGTGRIYIWKKTIKVIPKYLLHGVGIDNYKYILDGKPIIRYHYRYDKAHNFILQILITEGIFCLISYICFYILIFKNNIKNLKNREIYLLLPIIGYLVQGMFSISVITVAPIYYIILGLSINRKIEN